MKTRVILTVVAAAMLATGCSTAAYLVGVNAMRNAGLMSDQAKENFAKSEPLIKVKIGGSAAPDKN